MIETLALPATLRAQLEQEAKDAFPHECCGLVEGVREGAGAWASTLHPASNLAREPDRFEIDPAAHITLLRGLRGTTREIIGCYHSHPKGRPEPSPRDIAGAGEMDFLWLIAALENKDVAPIIAALVWTGAAFAPVRTEIR